MVYPRLPILLISDVCTPLRFDSYEVGLDACCIELYNNLVNFTIVLIRTPRRNILHCDLCAYLTVYGLTCVASLMKRLLYLILFNL
jgi:hypothetical protein